MAPIHRKPGATAASTEPSEAVPDQAPQQHANRPSNRPSQATVFLLTVLTALVSLLILYNQEVITPNEWPSNPHLHQLTSDSADAQFQAALDKASHFPLVVIFYSPHCIACKRARKPFFKVVNDLHTRAHFFAVPLGEHLNRHYIADFQLKHVPSIFFIRGNDANDRILYNGKRNYAHMRAFITDNLPS